MAARFCPECGQEIPSAARFCPNCAARLDGSTPTVMPARVPRPPLGAAGGVDAAASGSRKLLVPGMIAALLVLAIGVALLAARLHQQSNMLASAAPPPVPAPALTNAPAVAPPPRP